MCSPKEQGCSEGVFCEPAPPKVRGQLYREEIKFSGRWSTHQYAIEDGWLRDLEDASEPKIMLKLAKVSAPKTARNMLAFRIVAHNTRRVLAASPEDLHSWMQIEVSVA